MFIITCPSNRMAEREYIIDIVFGEFLGLDYMIHPAAEAEIGVRVTLSENDGKELVLSDRFFRIPESTWLTKWCLAKDPLPIWPSGDISRECCLVRADVPVVFGENPDAPDFLVRNDHSISLGLDVLGSAFFLMSRYEEIVGGVHDAHGRFPAGIRREVLLHG